MTRKAFGLRLALWTLAIRAADLELRGDATKWRGRSHLLERGSTKSC